MERVLEKTEDCNSLILDEIIFQLGELIFFTDMIRQNAYYCLRRLMHDYKVNTVRGIKECQWCMNQLNDYINFVPSKALDKQNTLKEEFTEIDMREILGMGLPESYRNKLFGIDWNIYEENFYKTVDKLKNFEPKIQAEASKAKSNRELANKVYSTKGTKCGLNSSNKVAEVEKTTCKHCGKQHKGEYWSKKGNNNNNNNGKQQTTFGKREKDYIKQMIKSKSKSSKKNNSDSQSSTPDWKKGVNQIQQMYIAKQFRVNNNMDSDAEIGHIDGNQLQNLQKKAKAAEKQFKQS